MSIGSEQKINRNEKKLPIILIKIGEETYPALCDSGAAISLMNERIFERIKDKVKITYISRQVTLQTLTKERIPFSKSVQISTTLGTTRCRALYFVTRQHINNDYQIILGFDFMANNKIVLDLDKQVLKIKGEELEFAENQINKISKVNDERRKFKDKTDRLGDCKFNENSYSRVKNKEYQKNDKTERKDRINIKKNENSEKESINNKPSREFTYSNTRRNPESDKQVVKNMTGEVVLKITENNSSNSIKNNEKKETGDKKIEILREKPSVTNSESEQLIELKQMMRNLEIKLEKLFQNQCAEQIIQKINTGENGQGENILQISNEKIKLDGKLLELADKEQAIEDSKVQEQMLDSQKNKLDKKISQILNIESSVEIKKFEHKGKRFRTGNFARLTRKVILTPGAKVMVDLKVDEKLSPDEMIMGEILRKNLSDEENFIQKINTQEKVTAVLINKYQKEISLNKGMKIARITRNIVIGKNEEDLGIKQINMITKDIKLDLKTMHNMRKEEFNITDFKLDHLPEKEKDTMQELLKNNYAAFSKSYRTLGSTDIIKPKIKLTHNFPIQCKAYPLPKKLNAMAEKEIQELVEARILEPTDSSYAFPVIFVKKNSTDEKGEHKYRMATDFRLLNEITELYSIHIPLIQDLVQDIAGYQYYTTMDLKSAFFQIELPENEREKCAIITHLGNFKINKLAFGLRNSASYFTELMNVVLGDIKKLNIYYYLDDIIIPANDLQELRDKMKMVLERLIKYNLTVDPAKVHIAQEKIVCLGYEIDKTGITPADKNIVKIQQFRTPKNVKEIQSFLGMANYFRNLIPNYAELTVPLTMLTKKGTTFEWSKECEESFKKIQEIILSKPKTFKIDINKKYYLATDASKTAISGILMQKCENNLYPVQFYSRIIKPTEARYPSIKLELLAIYETVRHFHTYLCNSQFELISDAKSLKWHLDLLKITDVAARWVLYLSQYDFKFTHIAGEKNPADYLSRFVLKEAQVNNITQAIFEGKEDLSIENIRNKQREDENIMKIIKQISQTRVPEKFEDYFLDENEILRFREENKKLKTVKNVILIPKTLEETVIKIAHATHFGRQKTIDLIKSRYIFGTLYFKVREFINNCERCTKFKHRNIPKPPMVAMERKQNPGEMLALDIVGPIPRSNKGNSYILTIIDYFSRHLETFAISTISTQKMIQCVTDYFSKYGIPDILLSDNGTQFKALEFKQFLKNLGVEHRVTSVYTPKTNGILERTHRSLKGALICTAENTFEWEQALQWVKLYYNNAKHSATNFPPALLFFGRDLKLPLNEEKKGQYTNIFNFNEEELDKKQFYEFFKESILKNLKTHNYAYAFQKEVQRKQINARRGKERNFREGDLIYVKNFRKSSAWDEKFMGPFRILRLVHKNAVLVKNIVEPYKKPFVVNMQDIFKITKSEKNQERVQSKQVSDTPQQNNGKREVHKRTYKKREFVPKRAYDLRPRKNV